jgi:CheY-like chemotaxis protein
VLLCDWEMPGLSGPDTVAQAFRAIGPASRPGALFLVPGPVTAAQLEAASKAGAPVVISKPYSLAALQSALTEALSKTPVKSRRALKSSDHSELVAHLKGAKLLLVEDNEVNQLVASRILRKAGFQVEIANNGREGVEMFAKGGGYSLILMDIQMPEMDGIEATQAIRGLPGGNDIPIVAMTAHAMTGDRELSIKSGMNDHVNKPIDVQELFRTLARWLPGGGGGAGGAAPGGGAPGGEAPGEGAPGGESPGEGAPGVQSPGEGAPGVQSPGEGAPGGEAPVGRYSVVGVPDLSVMGVSDLCGGDE